MQMWWNRPPGQSLFRVSMMLKWLQTDVRLSKTHLPPSGLQPSLNGLNWLHIQAPLTVCCQSSGDIMSYRRCSHHSLFCFRSASCYCLLCHAPAVVWSPYSNWLVSDRMKLIIKKQTLLCRNSVLMIEFPNTRRYNL